MTAYALLAVGLIWAGLDIEDDVADWWLVWGLLIAVGASGLLWECAVNRLSATAQQAAAWAMPVAERVALDYADTHRRLAATAEYQRLAAAAAEEEASRPEWFFDRNRFALFIEVNTPVILGRAER
jgi:hypothetical protein